MCVTDKNYRSSILGGYPIDFATKSTLRLITTMLQGYIMRCGQLFKKWKTIFFLTSKLNLQ